MKLIPRNILEETKLLSGQFRALSIDADRTKVLEKNNSNSQGIIIYGGEKNEELSEGIQIIGWKDVTEV